ncbi:hypothetical protein [Marinobacterium rhizophilum]|uniref:hypothetical protein n=1 Tax=Marinobacterium rhizophilum TaxID=420402 RepID=UPI002101FE87|nr:hypothetical protein [Marinobacterium rhizophilum]
MKLNTLLKPSLLAPMGLAALVSAVPASADQEYLLTITRPGHLHVTDMATNTVERSCDIPGAFGSGSIALAPDGKTAYVLSNKTEDVYGISIQNSDISFHAEQSEGNIRVKSVKSITVSTDGTELYIVQNPV